ncbi:hypothetical protein BGL_2c00490 [Burkholderia plantarii]|uniref:Uncharacterized protein n=2 Tax=Burkholderia plantarii TaxID=41899 RepID=A0A0B6RS20_BURPL|nr:hypothetical protein BGL_2c00490 [Burkholderia plantarii]
MRPTAAHAPSPDKEHHMAHTKRSIDEHLDEWLRDAHAMEEQAGTMLAAMARRLEHYPDLKQRIEQHLGETREQARLIRECIGRRGSDVSALKDLGARSLATLQGFTSMLAADEVVKGAIASYAFENFEIATYRTLITAARTAGDADTLTVCERILPQEVAMANWLEQHLPQVVNAFLTRNPENEAASR